MHPKIRQESAGLCPECGMNLVPTRAKPKKDKEFDKHHGHSTNVFKMKFWVSFVLSIPIVLYAEVTQELFNYRAPVFPGSEYLPFVLASVIFFYGGWVFITSAYRELIAKLPGMMTLIALAISTAYIYSVYVTVIGEDKTLFWELATLITVMLLGHWMEMRAVSGAQSALKELSKLLPDTAEVLRHGIAQIVPLGELVVGDLVLVKPGGKIPADGAISEGMSEINEAVATGESKPVAKKRGDEVIAGTINGDGSLKITVTKIGEKTFLAGVMRLVMEAQASKSRLQMLSDRAAFYLTIIAVVVGGITLTTWLFVSETAFAIERMVAVLVITCPHALGLAIPLVASISTTKAARNGFLVKQRLALEAARNIDVVLFDKTGTLTKGEFGVDKIISTESDIGNLVLQYSASVNSHSEHPAGKATVAEAKKRNIAFLDIKDFQRIPGKGVRAKIKDKEVLVGSAEIVKGFSFPEALKSETEKLSKQGKTINFVAVDGKIIGAIALADLIRQESREAISALREMKIKTAMLTGDAEDVAKWVAGELQIDEYFARVMPDQKSDKVKVLQSTGRKIAMVGDGVNDAPALTQADLGIAIGAGTNVALESAGIILVKNDPRDIAKIIKLSRLTYSKMVQNLFWATGYNIVAIPLAAGVLAFKGILLQPALAAILMSLSTVIVAANAMLLRGRKL
ncbi:MAG: heavy metal translocating P-type ATPase [Candidatus Harrisonbacteria bacterium]|nr:heavy metal translocating P-type ATPase [Candidatus Harrisonbacteria bacterium]